MKQHRQLDFSQYETSIVAMIICAYNYVGTYLVSTHLRKLTLGHLVLDDVCILQHHTMLNCSTLQRMHFNYSIVLSMLK